MHMVVQNHRERVAVPLFGLNAPDDTLGVLMVTARTGSESGVIAILPFVPDGTPQSDMSIRISHEPTGLALVQSTMVAEGGFCFDGVYLSDVQYLYFDGSAEMTLDVSFVPNRIPVREG